MEIVIDFFLFESMLLQGRGVVKENNECRNGNGENFGNSTEANSKKYIKFATNAFI